MNTLIRTIAALIVCTTAAAGEPVTLQKTVSREHPLFNATGRCMSIGRDGMAYVVSSGGYLLRLKPDGSDRRAIRVPASGENVAANADGVIAIANSHIGASVNVFSRDLKQIGKVREFLAGDNVGYGNPGDIQVGAESGHFYAIDQYRDRILRIAAPERVVTIYSTKGTGETFMGRSPRFRVNERLQRFYIGTPENLIHALTFDGKKLWTVSATIGGNSPPYDGEFDIDGEGNLYVLVRNEQVVQVFTPEGKPSGQNIALKMDGRNGVYTSLVLSGDEIFVKRVHDSELFQVYDRKSGAFKRAVQPAMEQLKVEFPDGPVWTADRPVPVKIAVAASGKTFQPPWPVQVALYNDPQWRDLPVVDGAITPPADMTGLLQVRVGYGESRVETVVEVRVPDSRGSVSILTPLNRVYYGRGEEIPARVIVRALGGDSNIASAIGLTLTSRGARAEAADVLKVAPEEIKWLGDTGRVSISPAMTARLRPGRYLLTATVPGFTVAPQPLVIGTGLRERPIFNTIYGDDYVARFTRGDTFEAPHAVATHAAWAQKMGVNMFIERLGDMLFGEFTKSPDVTQLVERLTYDALAVAPEKAELENVLKQTVAANGAHGIEEQSVLIYMDSVIPFDLGPEKPRLTGVRKTLKTTTEHLLPYPAFRGWSWASNWWMNRNVEELSNKAVTRKEWETARDKALETGKWDPEIERISDLWVSLIPQYDKAFNETLKEVAPGKPRALSGPYRQPAVIPPIAFRDADEVELYVQTEQVQPPFLPPHMVDFYKRPGKRTWGHLETYNDDGTGQMILPQILQLAMRGAEGAGYDGTTEIGWGTGKDTDPRTSGQGSMSMHRALNALLRSYGPWLTTLQANDPIAIVVSTRMMRLDEWDYAMGSRYFARLFEAYTACMFAHRPASFVFTEDLKPGTLEKFKAVLVVGQRVELDPPLAEALGAARRGGVPVFCDETCRPEIVSAFKPLGTSFSNIEKDNVWQDDSAYQRYPQYAKTHAAAMIKTLGTIVPPVAGVDNPEVMLSELRNGEGRFVWALNNDLPDWEPGVIWRVAMFMASRVPQVVPIDLKAQGKTVYEAFSMRAVTGKASADLRDLPARLFAVLPRPIESVKLTAPTGLKAGDDLKWTVAVSGPKMSYPLRLRLLDADGAVIEEQFPIKLTGAFTVPINASAAVTLEATELISGKRAQQKVQVASGIAPGKTTVATAQPSPMAVLPVEKLFGPHLRDIAISTNGSSALINAMNWEDNYYIVDLKDGAVRSQGAVGHHYAYAPAAGPDGFFLQGYDLGTGEGYHLYELSAGGAAPARRFATYGLPLRGTKVFGGPKLPTPINNFLVSPKGDWIANSGNLGLIVWSKDGKKLWSQDWWSETRQITLLLGINDDAFVTLAGMTATAHKPRTGQKLWEIQLAETGTLQGGAASADGRTLALFSNTEKGRIFVLRDGKLVNTYFVPAENVAITPDGRHVAAIVNGDPTRITLSNVGGKELHWFAADGGVEWVFQGDQWLHGMKISPDGKRIAFASDIGTLFVLNDRGQKVIDRDFGTLPTAAWLAGGDLLVATWTGDVVRMAQGGSDKWKVRIASKGKSRLDAPVVAETLLTVAPTFGNAVEKPASLSPNLLAEAEADIRVTGSRTPAAIHALQNDVAALTDGRPDAPARPWADWHTISNSDSAWTGGMAIEVESIRNSLRVDAVTFVEDPKHPESWLRDMRMQVWDAVKEMWVDGPYLVSNTSTHTHRFAKPVEGSKFRFIGTGGPNWDANIGGVGWPVGKLRLGELVFHGQVAGPTHPDAAANRPVAVLFDESESSLRGMQGIKFQSEGAFAGERCLVVNAGIAGPTEIPKFGAAMPGWDFEIVENPTQPGQYRWIQFAWKSLSKDTRGMAVLVGPAWATDVYGIVAGAPSYAGLPDGRASGDSLPASQSVASTPPQDWQVVRIDLWAALKKPTRIRWLGAVSTGGGAALDAVKLGRTEADLLASPR